MFWSKTSQQPFGKWQNIVNVFMVGGHFSFSRLLPFYKSHLIKVTRLFAGRQLSTVTTLEPVAIAQREWTMNTPCSVIGQRAHREQWTPPSCLAPCLIMTTSTTTDRAIFFITYMSMNTIQISIFSKNIVVSACVWQKEIILFMFHLCLCNVLWTIHEGRGWSSPALSQQN